MLLKTEDEDSHRFDFRRFGTFFQLATPQISVSALDYIKNNTLKSFRFDFLKRIYNFNSYYYRSQKINFLFRFFIKSGNPRDYFAVKQREDNPKKALLTIRYPPDREFQDLYTMQLVVMDEGGISGLYCIVSLQIDQLLFPSCNESVIISATNFTHLYLLVLICTYLYSLYLHIFP